MVRFIIMLVVVGLTMGVAQGATAQDRVGFDVRGTYAVPTGDFAADGFVENGVGAGVGVRIRGSETWSGYIAADLHSFSLDVADTPLTSGQTQLTVLSTGFEVAPEIEGSLGPVLFAGATFTRGETELEPGGSVTGDFRLGGELGGGVRFMSNERVAITPTARLRLTPAGEDEQVVSYVALGLTVSFLP